VIADFADVTLEDYAGTGFTTVSDVRAELELMGEHWAWLSRGRETLGWDIVRVTLPVPFTFNAYADATSFRTAVLDAAAAKIDPTRYDLNGDGKMDVVWVIASSQDDVSDNGFLTRGMSELDRACVFVDAQGGSTASERNTGMFNYEVARCALGLPTLAGTYGTLGYLSLLDVSYPQPGQDFSAYERVRAGWTQPQRVTQSTTGIELTLKDDPDVLLVPGATEAEYFLMEYRRRPASGFGSGGLNYDGVVVYHVLESSQQAWNPPLLKVEAADGVIAAQTAANAADLVYPENSSLVSPLSYRTYAGGAEVFRIQNLTRNNETLRFDIVLAAPSPTNLLLNPDFEQGYGLPARWDMEESDPSATHIGEIDGADGGRSVSITASTPNDANWHQAATGLSVGQSYLFCGKLRGEKAASTGGTGANLYAGNAFDRSQPLTGSFDWTNVCLPFDATATSMNVGCRLGYTYSMATGVVRCDDMALYQLVKPF
jgi:M6 family metalloprotease-like protein